MGLEEELNNSRVEYEKAYAKRDVDALLAFYHDDGQLLWPFQNEPVMGKEAIRKSFEHGSKEDYTKINRTMVKVKQEGELGFESGTYKAEEGPHGSFSGSYLMVYKKQNTKWMIYVDAFNLAGHGEHCAGGKTAQKEHTQK